MLYWKRLEEKLRKKLKRLQLRVRHAVAFFIISKEFDNEQHAFGNAYDDFMFESIVYMVNRIGMRVGLKKKDIINVLITIYNLVLDKEAVNEVLSKGR